MTTPDTIHDIKNRLVSIDFIELLKSIVIGLNLSQK
mgnify:CR=1 FL=1